MLSRINRRQVSRMGYWANFGDIFWWFLTAYAFFAVLYALFVVIGDIFRDRNLNGWLRAAWIAFLAFLPVVGLLAYLVVRGRGLTQRAAERTRQKAGPVDHPGEAVAAGPAEEITKAKVLLDAGAITPDEFQRIKRRVLI